MRLDWNIDGGAYTEVGGSETLQEAVSDALTVLPREHLRQLTAIVVQDTDPRGKALGIWRQDHHGVAIEIYAAPHVTPLLGLPPAVRLFALRLHLAYTLFHEVGHHVTRFLNRRAAPPRKAVVVDQKIERWADDYAEKRLGKLIALWLRPEGIATTPASRRALETALQALRLTQIVGTLTGTNSLEASSEERREAPAAALPPGRLSPFRGPPGPLP